MPNGPSTCFFEAAMRIRAGPVELIVRRCDKQERAARQAKRRPRSSASSSSSFGTESTPKARGATPSYVSSITSWGASLENAMQPEEPLPKHYSLSDKLNALETRIQQFLETGRKAGSPGLAGETSQHSVNGALDGQHVDDVSNDTFAAAASRNANPSDADVHIPTTRAQALMQSKKKTQRHRRSNSMVVSDEVDQFVATLSQAQREVVSPPRTAEIGRHSNMSKVRELTSIEEETITSGSRRSSDTLAAAVADLVTEQHVHAVIPADWPLPDLDKQAAKTTDAERSIASSGTALSSTHESQIGVRIAQRLSKRDSMKKDLPQLPAMELSEKRMSLPWANERMSIDRKVRELPRYSPKQELPVIEPVPPGTGNVHLIGGHIFVTPAPKSPVKVQHRLSPRVAPKSIPVQPISRPPSLPPPARPSRKAVPSLIEAVAEQPVSRVSKLPLRFVAITHPSDFRRDGPLPPPPAQAH